MFTTPTSFYVTWTHIAIIQISRDPREKVETKNINMAKVFIGNLPDAAKGNDVEDFFSKYGRIREINLKSGYGKFVRKE